LEAVLTVFDITYPMEMALVDDSPTSNAWCGWWFKVVHAATAGFYI
jgi:hypothetical protein